LLTLVCLPAVAQSAADDANKSNNPLNLAASFNLQNYFVPSLFGSRVRTNDFLLRPTIPVRPNAPVASGRNPGFFEQGRRSARD
jgi:hypothetical protein